MSTFPEALLAQLQARNIRTVHRLEDPTAGAPPSPADVAALEALAARFNLRLARLRLESQGEASETTP